MPSTITHAYIGLDTVNKLNNKPRKIINDRIDNYKIYCQNMDVLYFYHLLLLVNNKVRHLGHEFHHQKSARKRGRRVQSDQHPRLYQRQVW